MAMNFNKSNNAKKLMEIQQKGVQESNTSRALDIKLDLIDKNPMNAEIFTMNDIDILAENIKEIGLLTPINVYLKDDGRYEIASGHRRYEALKKLGRDTAKCYVQPYPDSEIDVAKNLIDSNIQTRKMTPLDMARALRFYHQILIKEKVKGDKRALVAQHFNMSSSHVQRYWSLLELIPELQELGNSPEYPMSAICQANVLSKENQKVLYGKLIQLKKLEIGKGNNDEEDEIIVTRTNIHQLIRNLEEKEKFIKQQKTEEKELANIRKNVEFDNTSAEEPIENLDVEGDYDDIEDIDNIQITEEDYKTFSKPRKKKEMKGFFKENEVISEDFGDVIEDIDAQNKVTVQYIDDELSDFERNLELLVSSEKQIKDKKYVNKQIERIKALLDKIS